MNKSIGLAILIMLLFTIPAYAENYNCTDNETLHYSTVITVDSTNIPIEYNETCTYGCDNTTNTCNPPEWEQSLIIIGVVFLVFGIVIIVAWRLAK